MTQENRFRITVFFLSETKIRRENLQITCQFAFRCPNRDGTAGTGGCIFCGEEGADFELLPSSLSVKEQIEKNKEYIGKKYNAKKYIIYFQNYSNTYFPYSVFCDYMRQAVVPNTVALYISTRPDCIYPKHMEFLKEMKENGIDIVLRSAFKALKTKHCNFESRPYRRRFLMPSKS